MPTATADLSPTRVTGSSRTPSPSSISDRSRGLLGRVVPADSYVAFRVAFGLLIAIGQIRFLARGWVAEFYLDPEQHLTYPGFDWVRPLPPLAMYALVVGLAVAGVMIAFGVRTRPVAGLFAVGFAYCELIDAALYLNHYWFVTLAAVALAVAPEPTGRSVPLVTVWVLRFQVGIVYLFAGLAKLNHDWIVRAEPLRTWLAARTDRPLVGGLLDEAFVAFAFSWVGAAFDLTIVAWLLWSRSRPFAYVVLVVFHLATALLFQIGMFPWIMIALTPIFFAPTWPRRWKRGFTTPLRNEGSTARSIRVGRTVVVAMAALVAVNLALPLRHLAADGNVRWNDDGYLLSWRVMLTERSSHVTYHVVDPTTGTVTVVRPEAVLTEWQSSAAMVRADLILSTAHLVAAAESDRLGRDVEVYADALVAWNGRLRTVWIDPTVDLAAIHRSSAASDYVLDAPT